MVKNRRKSFHFEYSGKIVRVEEMLIHFSYQCSLVWLPDGYLDARKSRATIKEICTNSNIIK